MQVYICNKGGKYWKSIQDWARSKSIFTEKEHSLLKIAASIPRKVPTENQSKAIAQLEEHAKREGFFHEIRHFT